MKRISDEDYEKLCALAKEMNEDMSYSAYLMWTRLNDIIDNMEEIEE